MAEPFDSPKAPADGKKGQEKPINLGLEPNYLMMEYQFSQDYKKKVASNAGPVDLAFETIHSFGYTGVQGPVRSLGQFADNALHLRGVDSHVADSLTFFNPPTPADFGSGRWYAQQTGNGAGILIPFFVTKNVIMKRVSLASRMEAGAIANSGFFSKATGAMVIDGTAAGFVNDFLFRPVDPTDQLDVYRAMNRRFNHGLTGAAALGPLTAGSIAIRQSTRGMVNSIFDKSLTAPKTAAVAKFGYDATAGALPGIPAGFLSAHVDSKLNKGRWANFQEVSEGMWSTTFAGGMLSAFHQTPGTDIPTGDIVQSYRSRRGLQNNLDLAKADIDAKVGGDKVGGDAAVTGKRASDSRAGKPAIDGKTMFGGDVEGKKVPYELHGAPEAVVKTGFEMAYKASDRNATPQDVQAFFEFAQTAEGKAAKQALLDIAKGLPDDPAFTTMLQEAYLPNAVECRVVPGNVEIKTGHPPTQPEITAWQEFLAIVQDVPTKTGDYALFRHKVFNWLNDNPTLHDWALQYGKQNKHSKIAGPLDFYFGTAELGRFVAVSEGRRAANPFATPGPRTVNFEPIRIDLTAEQAQAGKQGDAPKASPLIDTTGLAGLSGLEPQRFAGGLPEIVDPLSTAKRGRGGSTVNDMVEGLLDKSGAKSENRQRIDAQMLAKDNIGDMTPEQFAKFIEYLYEKPGKAKSETDTRLKTLLLINGEGFAHPVVQEAYSQFRGWTKSAAEGGKAVPSLEAIHKFLSPPERAATPDGAAASAKPLPDWLSFYIESRLAHNPDVAKGENPFRALGETIPPCLLEALKAEYVTPAKLAGREPTYSKELPPELVEAMEAARKNEPPKSDKWKDKPKPPVVNDATLRLGKLNDVMNITDPVIRDRLLELGKQDHTALDNIVNKLDTTRNAPEYADLLRMILPEAENIRDVKLLLDTIHFGNKAHRADRGSDATNAHRELAMALVEKLCPHDSEPAQRLVNDLLTGKIRPPEMDRFGGGGRGQQGRPGPGNQPKQTGGGVKKLFETAPPRPAPIILTMPQAEVPGVGAAEGGAPKIFVDVTGEGKPVDVQQVGVDKGPGVVGSEKGGTQPVIEQKGPGVVTPEKTDGPQVVELKGSGEVKTGTPEKTDAPPVVEQQTTGDGKTVTQEKTDAPPVVEKQTTGDGKTVTPEKTDAPPVVEQQTTGDGKTVTPEKADAPPVVEQQVGDGKAGATGTAQVKHGSRVKIEGMGKDTYYMGVEATSGDVIVRAGKPNSSVMGTNYTAKTFGRLGLTEVGTDAQFKRTIYRDASGLFFSGKQQGSGVMIYPAPEYSLVKPEVVNKPN